MVAIEQYPPAVKRHHGRQCKVLGEVQIRTVHWSDDHRFQIYSAAKRILRQFPQFHLDIDELVNEGYLRHLRYVEHPCPSDSRALMSVMYKYVMRQYIRFKDDEHPSDMPHRDEEVYIASKEMIYDSFQELYNHFFGLIPKTSQSTHPNTIEHENRGLKTVRTAFRQVFYEQKSQREVAAGLGVTRQAVEFALKRAKKHIKSSISEELYVG